MAEWHFRRGQAFAAATDWESAISAYQAAIAQKGGKAEWHYRLGRAFMATRSWESAISAYQAAIAQKGGKAEWHYRLGRAFAMVNRPEAAIASYREALLRDGSKAQWHYRLGSAHESVGSWVEAEQSYKLALALLPDHDLCRYRLARCANRRGRRDEALRILMPVIKKNDDHLKNLKVVNDLTVLTKTPLFISGDCTRSARKIETVCGIARRAYFEHSSNLTTGRVAKFYNYLRDKYGSHAPSFIPRLHCYQCFENYTLYLYDYINQSTSHVFGRDVMCRLVDCLVRVNKEFYDVGDTSILLRRLRKRFSLSNLESFFENQLAAREAPYREEVKTLIPRLKSVFSDVMSLPKMFSHADLHGPSQEHSGNVIVSTSGDVFLIDWNRYGYAPLAFDLVAFFETMWNSNVFEEASDYYFDKSCPRMTLKQRRYTIALVMTAYSMLENVSLSRKWLEYAIRYG